MILVRFFLVSLLCLGAVIGPRLSAQARPPNVLFLMADDMNTSLGAYGHPLVKSPNLDALAARGVRFDRAYCQFVWCNPSRASLLTGRRPTELRVYDLHTQFRATTPDAVTLPEYFRNHGYTTMRVGKIFHYAVPGDIGTAGADDPDSWDQTENPMGRDILEMDRLVNLTPDRSLGGGLSYREDDGPDEEQTDGKIATAAIRMLENAGEDPFFLAVGFFRPHVPFISPKKYFDLYPRESIPLPRDPGESLTHVPPEALSQPLFWGLEAEQQRDIIRAYYASASFMDAQVGRVLDALDRLGLAENTVVVFLSDHGLLLGEHGQWQKLRLFEESVRTPMIIAAPGGCRGGVVPGPVELVDLFPTLVELADLPGVAGLAGRSLTPLLARPDDPWPYAAFSQTVNGTTIRTERWRYNEWGERGKGGVELYDHGDDPDEYHNLAQDPAFAGVIAELRGQLHAAMDFAPAKPDKPVIAAEPRDRARAGAVLATVPGAH